jgi:hypothetical protein
VLSRPAKCKFFLEAVELTAAPGLRAADLHSSSLEFTWPGCARLQHIVEIIRRLVERLVIIWRAVIMNEEYPSETPISELIGQVHI